MSIGEVRAQLQQAYELGVPADQKLDGFKDFLDKVLSPLWRTHEGTRKVKQLEIFLQQMSNLITETGGKDDDLVTIQKNLTVILEESGRDAQLLEELAEEFRGKLHEIKDRNINHKKLIGSTRVKLDYLITYVFR